jgi:preprotein translocase subunit SecE
VAQQENAPNKPVHLMYLCGAVLLFYLTMWSVDWVWGYFTYWPLSSPPSELSVSLFSAAFAIIAAVICYRHDRVYSLANEVAGELKKVTWPTAKEVRAATTTVIVMALISAVILGVFDAIWSNLTELVYG